PFLAAAPVPWASSWATFLCQRHHSPHTANLSRRTRCRPGRRSFVSSGFLRRPWRSQLGVDRKRQNGREAIVLGSGFPDFGRFGNREPPFVASCHSTGRRGPSFDPDAP